AASCRVWRTVPRPTLHVFLQSRQRRSRPSLIACPRAADVTWTAGTQVLRTAIARKPARRLVLRHAATLWNPGRAQRRSPPATAQACRYWLKLVAGQSFSPLATERLWAP